MSQPPKSNAPYIIICSGRMAVRNAKGLGDKAVAASLCAAQLCAYMGIRYRQSMKSEDMNKISQCQHWLMDYLDVKIEPGKDEVEMQIRQLIAEMYVLEQKYIDVAY